MALPHKKITKIPNNEPDAVPSLWNVRYQEIDENFEDLDGRTEQLEADMQAARGDSDSVAQRLSDMGSQLEGLSPEYQAELSAAVMYAADQAAQAARGVQALRGHLQQEGEITLINRGVVRGCGVTKSTGSTRNLNLEGGIAFMHGRMYSASPRENAASVPVNTGNSSVVVRAFLYYHQASDSMRLSVTPIGETVPDYGIHIYNITIPAGSTDETDPELDYVTLTNVRRVEKDFPRHLSSPQPHSVSIETLSKDDYRVDIDIVSLSGEPCRPDQVLVVSRSTNGFVVRAETGADNIVARWRVSKLNN